MGTNNYNKTYTITRQRLNAMLLWSYNYGKNDGGEVSFKRERDEKVDKMESKQWKQK